MQKKISDETERSLNDSYPKRTLLPQTKKSTKILSLDQKNYIPNNYDTILFIIKNYAAREIPVSFILTYKSNYLN